MNTVTIKIPSRKSRLVAVNPSKNFAVVAHGNTLKTVIAKAHKAGMVSPAIMWIPDPRKRYIY